MSAACSLPGVLLTQVAAMRALTRQGMDFAATPPVAVAGHSQGVLAVKALRAAGAKDVELLALAQLIGAAATLVARRRGITVLGDRSPMVSVTNADTKRIAPVLNEFGKDVRTVGLPLGLMRLHFVTRHRPKSVRRLNNFTLETSWLIWIAVWIAVRRRDADAASQLLRTS
jgi:malonyl CoA-acyl carrier protein transacylase